MIEGKTTSGFEFKIEDDALNDMELLDAFMAVDAGRISGMQAAIIRLLGEDQKKALYDFLRDKTSGRVNAYGERGVIGAVTEILHIAGEQSKSVKN